jgi:signal transduction histidine kinase
MNNLFAPAKIDLKEVLPATILDHLIPPFEGLFNLEGMIGVRDSQGRVCYGAANEDCVRYIYAPIIVDSQEIGTVGLCRQTGDFRAQNALDYLARSLSAVALETWRQRKLSGEVLERYDELNLIYDMGTLISSRGLSQDEIVKAVLDETNRIVRAEAGVIYIYSSRNHELTPVNYFGRSDELFWMGRTRELAMSTLYAYETAQLSDSGKVICAPLRHGEERLGALVLMYDRQDRTFSANDVNLLTMLTYNTALFIQAAHLYERVEQRNKELEQALKDLKSARDELSRAEQLSIIGQTVGGLIHDMRNPLNIVMGYAGLLQEGGLSEEENREYATQIIQYVNTFSSMAQEILDYTQSDDRIELKPVSVANYMKYIEGLLNPPGLKRSVNIVVNADAAGDFKVNIDTQRFARVFQNLVNNAVDAIEEHGGTRVDVRVESLDKKWLRFLIMDDGPGVPADMVSKIFEPFVTGKAHGTGLGLAIVDRMIAKHGGNIHYETAPTGGACFVFTLPKV